MMNLTVIFCNFANAPKLINKMFNMGKVYRLGRLDNLGGNAFSKVTLKWTLSR
jgi:hypothetical protein